MLVVGGVVGVGVGSREGVGVIGGGVGLGVGLGVGGTVGTYDGALVGVGVFLQMTFTQVKFWTKLSIPCKIMETLERRV